jgi:hypothetical protein
MLIIIIITGVINNMNKFSKYSHFGDLIRIKSGYMPKRHFMSLYQIVVIFMVSKLFLYRACKKFIAGFFNSGKLHKKCPLNTFGVNDHTQ